MKTIMVFFCVVTMIAGITYNAAGAEIRIGGGPSSTRETVDGSPAGDYSTNAYSLELNAPMNEFLSLEAQFVKGDRSISGNRVNFYDFTVELIAAKRFKRVTISGLTGFGITKDNIGGVGPYKFNGPLVVDGTFAGMGVTYTKKRVSVETWYKTYIWSTTSLSYRDLPQAKDHRITKDAWNIFAIYHINRKFDGRIGYQWNSVEFNTNGIRKFSLADSGIQLSAVYKL